MVLQYVCERVHACVCKASQKWFTTDNAIEIVIITLHYNYITDDEFVYVSGFFYYIWSPDKPVVDRDKCSCDCFDTVFRGEFYITT